MSWIEPRFGSIARKLLTKLVDSETADLLVGECREARAQVLKGGIEARGVLQSLDRLREIVCKESEAFSLLATAQPPPPPPVVRERKRFLKRVLGGAVVGIGGAIVLGADGAVDAGTIHVSFGTIPPWSLAWSSPAGTTLVKRGAEIATG